MKTLFDLHTHTPVSGHAFSTLEENTEEAGREGLRAIGTSDHAEKMPGVNPNVFINYKVVQKSVEGVWAFCGIETNTCGFDGTIDVEESLLRKMDYVTASLHAPHTQSGTAEQNTAALIGAMKNTYVKVIAHPDDSRYPLDYEALVQAARELEAVLGLNSSSLIPDSTRLNDRENAKVLLNTCRRFGASMILGGDMHVWYDAGRFEEAYALLEEVSFPQELILDLSPDGIRAILNGSCTRI